LLCPVTQVFIYSLIKRGLEDFCWDYACMKEEEEEKEEEVQSLNVALRQPWV